jgi:hypothetical protein
VNRTDIPFPTDKNLFVSALSDRFDLTDFSCGRDDIDDFLKDDALQYQNQKLASTYLVHSREQVIVGYFSILNDSLSVRSIAGNERNRFNRRLPNNKRINQYPSIKIGRVGVSEELHGTGFAYLLMDFIKWFSVQNLNPACRLIILDAINEDRQLKYYNRNHFLFLMESDAKDKTRLMYFDLINFI